jgi:hypothetical protein
MLVLPLVLAISAPAAAQDQVPAALQSLKPHQIVEAVAAEQQTLDLTAVQVRRLDSLHLAIWKEPHRYEARPSNKAHRNVRMTPMISKKRAYADALAILTPEQRARASARFGDAAYRLPAELQRGPGAPDQVREPLIHHAAGAAPARESTGWVDSGEESLQHRGGETPPAVEGRTGKPTDPITHKE